MLSMFHNIKPDQTDFQHSRFSTPHASQMMSVTYRGQNARVSQVTYFGEITVRVLQVALTILLRYSWILPTTSVECKTHSL